MMVVPIDDLSAVFIDVTSGAGHSSEICQQQTLCNQSLKLAAHDVSL
jgi:hypothetical protein